MNQLVRWRTFGVFLATGMEAKWKAISTQNEREEPITLLLGYKYIDDTWVMESCRVVFFFF